MMDRPQTCDRPGVYLLAGAGDGGRSNMSVACTVRCRGTSVAGWLNAPLNQHGTCQHPRREMIKRMADAVRLGVAGVVRRQPLGAAVASPARPARRASGLRVRCN